MKIAHISDIHWRGLSRHEEYTRAFEALFRKLRDIRPDAIFLGGDYFHTKTSGISPEVIHKLAWMFRSFGDIAETNVILGNHDGNLANDSREDAISPIIKALNHPRVHLYKESGTFTFKTHDKHLPVLSVFSCFDKPGWKNVKAPTGMDIQIAAFHGSVGGSEMDNGWVMPDSKAEVQLSMFDGYSFVFLGDIHARQFLAERPNKNGEMKPYIAYPGSFIQQSHGEEELKGFLLWDIRSRDDWDVEFVEIPNLQPFITTPWAGTAEKTVSKLLSERGNLTGARVRVSADVRLSDAETRELNSLLYSAGVEEATHFSLLKNKYDSIVAGGSVVKKTSLRGSMEAMQALYAEFLEGNGKKFPLSLEQKELGAALIAKFVERAKNLETETTRNVSWSLKSFEFDNLYRYGSNNKLNFQALDGVVGVFGKNKTGKSSLVGALLYALFNGSDRDGVTRNGQIMNQSKSDCAARAVVHVDGVDYMIERSSQRVELPKKGKKATGVQYDPEKTETKLSFYKLTPGGREELNGISREDTDKAIRKLLGSPDDFLSTSVATQRRMEAFIDEGPTARKAILNRFLDLEIFESLFSFAKEETAALSAKLSALPFLEPEEAQRVAEEIGDLETALEETDVKIAALRQTELDQQSWLAKNNPVQLKNSLDSARSELTKKQELMANYAATKKTLLQSQETQELTIQNLTNELGKVDFDAIRAGAEKVSKLAAKVANLSASRKETANRLETQERNVRKLALVPCGDSFPTCRYIADAHEDKKALELTRRELEKWVGDLEEVNSILQEAQSQGYAEQHNRYNQNKNKLEVLKANLETTNEKLKSASEMISLASEAVSSLSLKVKDLEEQYASYNIEAIQQMERDRRETKSKITFLEQEKGRSMGALARLQVNQEMMEKSSIQREQLAKELKVLESVQAAFHRNGIPALVLKTQLPAINQEIETVLAGLVDFKIIFETEPGSNTLDILIEDSHSRRPLELGSGMEKMIASIAIRVALINLSSLPKADVFIIDEGFNALDEEHVGKCLELLQGLKQHFKTILVISHMQRVKEASDAIIEIVNTGQDSKLDA